MNKEPSTNDSGKNKVVDDHQLVTVAETLPATLTVSLLKEQAVILQQLLRVLQRNQLDTQWEYHFAAPKRASWVGEGLAWAERDFNQLGIDGWELIGFLEHGTAVFKRRLPGS